MQKKLTLKYIIYLILFFLLINTCKKKDTIRITLNLPAGLDTLIQYIPNDNFLTVEKVKLGKKLFFDKGLSLKNTIACADCHNPIKGFSDGRKSAVGIDSLVGPRGTPTIINRLFSKLQFWDGRADSLENQIFSPIRNPIEMNNTIENVISYLESDPVYQKEFQNAFEEERITKNNVEKAISSFVRTLLSGDSNFDKFQVGQKKMLSESAIRGFKIFNSKKSNCTDCHSGSNFTNEKFENTGVGFDKEDPDLGRYNVTKIDTNKGAFKVPTLRDISRTAPYMHDGSLKTLREVIDFYNDGGIPNKHLSKKMKKLNLTEQEKNDLIEFLKNLTGTNPWDYFQNE